MQLHIQHETVYRYAEAAKHTVQNLRLTPRRDPWQRTLHWQIQTPGRQHMQTDAYGNIVHLLTLDQPHHEIRIVVNGTVETEDKPCAPFPEDGLLSPLTYLAETALTHADPKLREFAARHLRPEGDRMTALMNLSEAIRDAVVYEKGATHVYDTAAEVFARGKGVCQDHTHIFIACCRAQRIPARYVSGYLYTEDEQLIASHAWVDAWLGERSGWMSIDVTHGIQADGRYCRLAVGRDYLDACPIRGVRRGGGADEKMLVAVNVSQTQQQQ
jgi:transglutaminase-like putative cysteine protease